MITLQDIERVTSTQAGIERLIKNAKTACQNSVTDWAKNYWFGVWKTLCFKYNRQDLYNKNLH